MKIAKFEVNLNPTMREFELMNYLDRRIFRETAKERFTKLDHDYIYKKFNEEEFPIEGNNLLSSYIFKFLEDNYEYLKRKNEIILVDIGAAGGALTTIFALKALNSLKLLEKTKIILVDVAKQALYSTQVGNFNLTKEFIAVYNLGDFGSNGKDIKSILSKAKYYCSDLLKLPQDLKDVDICITGFTHHHLNLLDKELACKEMERITRENGFIGIVDESLNYKQYTKWLKQHKNETNFRNELVPIAQESFITLDEHISLFSSIVVINKMNSKKYYCFWGVKK
ncbi:class I SAM-dependent methyltransferase [archaeon]|nr:class I SAM-dependent methyltransferase [archaeon]MBT4396715.1 class I SAM-dependent methyltransferase [archaeon]MBT4441325.1 class I SAM-dependent methyltransferase [archaeon]